MSMNHKRKIIKLVDKFSATLYSYTNFQNVNFGSAIFYHCCESKIGSRHDVCESYSTANFILEARNPQFSITSF